jgi:hypothetical protein
VTTSEYWSRQTNPKTGAKFESFRYYLENGNNGGMDVDDYISGAHGEELVKRLEKRFAYEEDIMCKDAQEFYGSLGLKAEIFNAEDYYERYILFTPLAMYTSEGKSKKYPVVFSHHGGGSSIEHDIFSTWYIGIAGKENFMVIYLQNTNWQSMDQKLAKIAQKYPVDLERVYVSGFSQGGFQTSAASYRIPQKLAAIAPCSNDMFRWMDYFDVPYTDEELNQYRELLVPFFQMVGQFEPAWYAPVNNWKPRRTFGVLKSPDTYIDPRKNEDLDPTRIHGSKGYVDADHQADKPKWGMGHPPSPPPGADVHEWAMGRVNKRMWLLGCEERDVMRCIGYENSPDDEFHHIVGMYGDKEEIETYFGYKHYVINIWNKDGINAFRFVVVQNNPHHQALMMAKMAWDFFKKFRRDSVSGKIIETK